MKVPSTKGSPIISQNSFRKRHFLVIFALSLFSLTSAQPRHYIDSHLTKLRGLPSWEIPKLPEIKRTTVLQRARAHFHGRVPRLLNTTCDMNCQMGRTTKPSSADQLARELGYETLDMRNAVLTKTVMEIGEIPPELFLDPLDIPTSPHVNNMDQITQREHQQENEVDKQSDEDIEYFYDDDDNVIFSEDATNEDDEKVDVEIHRRKRNIFGWDTRFSLPNKQFMTMYPFSTAVKLSTGCSGILLSPKHVLTSAHCIHDGKRYVKGVKKLKIGKMMKTMQKKKRGGKKNRKNKAGRKRKRTGGKSKKIRESEINQSQGERVRRDLSYYNASVPLYFKWVRAKKTHIPQGWLDARAKQNSKKFEFPLEYDYAVIELKRSLGDEFMDIGISPKMNSLPGGHRIHFTGFDSDRSNQMLYRFCAIEEESPDLMYHYCDAQEGTSGSGIYIRLYDGKAETWSRKVIGVFSGHQWVKFPDGKTKEYNTGVRLTPLKYAQICFWTKGDYSQCRGG